MGKKPGFTLIEILLVVSIIAILAGLILASINNSRKKARLNGVKTSVRSALPIIVSCTDSGGTVNLPAMGPDGTLKGGNAICPGNTAAMWPRLEWNYYYAGGSYGADCSFSISTGGGDAPILCNCAEQACR